MLDTQERPADPTTRSNELPDTYRLASFEITEPSQQLVVGLGCIACAGCPLQSLCADRDSRITNDGLEMAASSWDMPLSQIMTDEAALYAASAAPPNEQNTDYWQRVLLEQTTVDIQPELAKDTQSLAPIAIESGPMPQPSTVSTTLAAETTYLAFDQQSRINHASSVNTWPHDTVPPTILPFSKGYEAMQPAVQEELVQPALGIRKLPKKIATTAIRITPIPDLQVSTKGPYTMQKMVRPVDRIGKLVSMPKIQEELVSDPAIIPTHLSGKKQPRRAFASPDVNSPHPHASTDKLLEAHRAETTYSQTVMENPPITPQEGSGKVATEHIAVTSEPPQLVYQQPGIVSTNILLTIIGSLAQTMTIPSLVKEATAQSPARSKPSQIGWMEHNHAASLAQKITAIVSRKQDQMLGLLAIVGTIFAQAPPGHCDKAHRPQTRNQLDWVHDCDSE